MHASRSLTCVPTSSPPVWFFLRAADDITLGSSLLSAASGNPPPRHARCKNRPGCSFQLGVFLQTPLNEWSEGTRPVEFLTRSFTQPPLQCSVHCGSNFFEPSCIKGSRLINHNILTVPTNKPPILSATVASSVPQKRRPSPSQRHTKGYTRHCGDGTENSEDARLPADPLDD